MTAHGVCEPVRTCVGCRGRDQQARLLRVVLVNSPPPGHAHVAPDPARRAQGRGAYVHVDQVCLDAAVSRRAFGRTFRRSGILDAAAVARWVEEHV
ncbi:MAG TPA: YlxR family protein [Ornithinimicrobium sp.]|uniref:YlxR family protein n=1 Tax=Ornithinimicrobium sp. TaxID=1977084 RepID=UPI002B49738F|nr:YlxR family protein [Ornithinimicrobium sp.]HKJ11688.1 YlxR family protein [Ornithinimicrobium sp.]